jgi:hypothetical protein
MILSVSLQGVTILRFVIGKFNSGGGGGTAG